MSTCVTNGVAGTTRRVNDTLSAWGATTSRVGSIVIRTHPRWSCEILRSYPVHPRARLGGCLASRVDQ
nr:hypothetical protein JVH1_1561 [Rhodococcus sp. JVH1]